MWWTRLDWGHLLLFRYLQVVKPVLLSVRVNSLATCEVWLGMDLWRLLRIWRVVDIFRNV